MERMKAILTLTAALAFAVSPFTTSGFNGFSPDQFPIQQSNPPVQPAGYAFAIWGVIYVWLILGAGFGLLKRDLDPAWDQARWPLFASLVVGAAWIPAAQVSPPAATVMIIWMTVTAIIALVRCGRDDTAWLRGPIALYAGWLTAASCVATALVLAGYGVTGPQSAAIMMLALALAISVAVLRARARAWEYGAAVIWALAGIIVANAGPGLPNWPVMALSAVGIALLSSQMWKGLSRPAPVRR